MPKMLALCVPHVGAFDRSRPIHPSERFIVMQPGDAAAASSASPRRVMYTLCSVVSHTGSSTNGHYTAYSRTPTTPLSDGGGGTLSSWYLCDDESVKSVPSDTVLFPSDAASRRPYIMFYMGVVG
jgi:ubiquitin C-terminal hydrolase